METVNNKKILVKKVRIAILIAWALIIAVYWVTRYYQLKLNYSGSMPQKLWVVHVGDQNLKVGDYVVARFHDYRMADPFNYEYVVKQVGGIAGDKIRVIKANGYELRVPPPNKTSFMYVLDTTYPVFDILSGYHFHPLTDKNMIIPKGYYFLHGQRHPSFDSRYKEFGLIPVSQVYGKAYPIF